MEIAFFDDVANSAGELVHFLSTKANARRVAVSGRQAGSYRRSSTSQVTLVRSLSGETPADACARHRYHAQSAGFSRRQAVLNSPHPRHGSHRADFDVCVWRLGSCSALRHADPTSGRSRLDPSPPRSKGRSIQGRGPLSGSSRRRGGRPKGACALQLGCSTNPPLLPT